MQPRRSPGPLLLSVVLFIALFTTLLVGATASCGGRLVYVLDHPYVHLSMARTLSEHGVWGLTRHAFASASSSPLWTMLLALAMLATGPRAGWPLVLNLLAGLAVVMVTERAVRAHAPSASRGATLAVLCAVVVLAPLAPLVMTGEEALLQTALALAFALAAARAIEEPERAEPDRLRPDVMLPSLGVLLVATRFEGLFLVAAAALLLTARGRRRLAWNVAFPAVLPVFLYAVVGLSLDWFALPAPVMLRGNFADIAELRIGRMLGGTALESLFATPHLLVLAIAAIGLAGGRPPDSGPDRGRTMLLLFVGTTFFHLQFARTGSFHRYEAYLVTLGLVAVGCRLAARGYQFDRRRRVRRTLLAVVMLAPLFLRGIRAGYQVPRTASNLFELQFQLGQLLAEERGEAPPAVEDAGTVTWLTQQPCVDLSGRASADVARLRLAGAWGADALDDVTRRHGVQLVVLRLPRPAGDEEIPRAWTRLCTWRVPRHVTEGADGLAFYAAAPVEKDRLTGALIRFEQRLPRTVIVDR